MAPLALLTQPNPPRPLLDLHTTVALEAAIAHVAAQRLISPDHTWDPSVQLHVLASLSELAQQWIHDEVGHARHAGATWAEIGRLLGVPAATARASHDTRPRPAPHRRTPPPAPSVTNKELPFDID